MTIFQADRWIDMTCSRARVRCAGPDATRYLNGQLTNDVALAREDRALPACITNAKGRMEAEVVITRWAENDYLIDAPTELADFLPLRLEKYLIADDCEVTDADPLAAHFFLPHATDVGDFAASLPAAARVARSWRFGAPGIDLLLPNGCAVPELPMFDDEETEEARVHQGAPRWGAELDGDTLPPEALLDATHISYTKGCYIGQETISRLKSVGRTTRVLRHLSAAGGLRTGMELFAPGEAFADARALGRVTSTTRDGRLALAFVRRPHEADGVDLVCRDAESGESVSVVVRIPTPQDNPT